MAKIIAIVNPVPKTGKSTIANELSFALAKKHKVLLVDLDIANKSLRIKHDIHNHERKCLLEPTKDFFLYPKKNGLYVSAILNVYDKYIYHIIILDTPDHNCNALNMAIDIADYVLIPHANILGSFDGISKTIELISKIKINTDYGILINNYNSMKEISVEYHDMMLDELKASYGDRVYKNRFLVLPKKSAKAIACELIRKIRKT